MSVKTSKIVLLFSLLLSTLFGQETEDMDEVEQESNKYENQTASFTVTLPKFQTTMTQEEITMYSLIVFAQFCTIVLLIYINRLNYFNQVTILQIENELEIQDVIDSKRAIKMGLTDPVREMKEHIKHQEEMKKLNNLEEEKRNEADQRIESNQNEMNIKSYNLLTNNQSSRQSSRDDERQRSSSSLQRRDRNSERQKRPQSRGYRVKKSLEPDDRKLPPIPKRNKDQLSSNSKVIPTFTDQFPAVNNRENRDEFLSRSIVSEQTFKNDQVMVGRTKQYYQDNAVIGYKKQ